MTAETRLYRTIQTDSGPVQVEVNRRGCKGEWSNRSDEALAAITRAVIAQQRAAEASP